MKNIWLILILLFLGCKEEKYYPYPCKDGMCNIDFWIDPVVSPNTYEDQNGYHHITYWGPNYFTVKGELDQLNDEYVVNNVPLVDTIFDSNYWIWIDNLTFTVPVYSVFSWFSDSTFNNPIPVGNITYTLDEILSQQPPLNISGYQIHSTTDLDKPYSSTLFDTHSTYTYRPQHSFYLDENMVGDSLKVFIKVIYNSDIGERVEMEQILDMVID